MTEVFTAVRLIWFVLAKIPRLTGWLLRRSFPVTTCRQQLRIMVPGTHARFELLRVRPTPALTCVSVECYNPLPFAVELEFHRGEAVIDGFGIGAWVLNSRCKVPAAGFASMTVPEVPLVDQTVEWIRRRHSNCVRLQLTLYCRCMSEVQRWESTAVFEVLAYVNMDYEEARQGMS